MSFEIVTIFENKIAEFFGAPYGIAVDSCTHGIELCLRYTNSKFINCPKHTYISIPFLADKLNIDLRWDDREWVDYYSLTHRVIDAAVLWKRNSYLEGTYMCISFQFQKHLSLGRGGMILTDNKEAAIQLKKLSYDGRDLSTEWRKQDILTIGYHYYMTVEIAQLGLDKLEEAIQKKPKKWVLNDWPNLTELSVFKNK